MGFIDTVMDILGKVIEWIMDLLSVPINILVNFLVMPIYVIFLGVCKILDLFELVAKKLAGLDVVYVNGSAVTGDLTLSLLDNAIVWKTFAAMLALGSLLLFVTTFIAIVKSQMATGQKYQVRVVVANFIRSLINFAIVPVLSVAGIYFGNALLKALDAATNQTGVNTASGMIFLCASYDANKARDLSSDMYEHYLSSGSDYNTFVFEADGSNDGSAAAIDNAFAQQLELKGAFEYNIFHKIIYGSPLVGIPPALAAAASPTAGLASLLAGYESENFPSDRGIFFISTDEVDVRFTYYNVSLVYMYYDMASFNFFIGIGAGVILLFAYLNLIFGLIKRMYTLVVLFIISPPIIALYPLDEGRALGSWRQSFIGNTISAYATIVGMNIYLMLMGVFQTVTLFADTTHNSVSADSVTYVEAAGLDNVTKRLANIGISLANELCQTFIIIGGAMYLKQIVGEISRIVGANDALGEGAQGMQQMTAGIKKAAGAAATVAGAAVTGGAAVAAKGAATAAKMKARIDRAKQMKAAMDKAKKPKTDKGEGGGGSGGSSAPGKTDETKQTPPNGNGANGEAESSDTENEEQQQKDDVKTAENEAKQTTENLNATLNDTQEKVEQASSSKVKNALKKIGGFALHPISKTKGGITALKSGIGNKLSLNNLEYKALRNAGVPEEEIRKIEGDYRDKIRAANAYNPVKNPIKARLRGLREKYIDGNIMKGLSREDQGAAHDYLKEGRGRREAMRARTNELRDDLKIARATGDKEAIAEATRKLTDYSKAVAAGLQRNDAYWKAEGAFQLSMSGMQENLQKLLVDSKASQSDIRDMRNKMAKFQDERPDVKDF
ncbi:MAG: hypothetical protein IJW82_05270 [Clostridia bacterium]|nr:hypothetical protein [Clostridia bacterium]